MTTEERSMGLVFLPRKLSWMVSQRYASFEFYTNYLQSLVGRQEWHPARKKLSGEVLA